MTISESLPTPTHANLLCKLTKSLHGLKQSSHTWYQHFDNFLTQQGFTILQFDANIYVKR